MRRPRLSRTSATTEAPARAMPILSHREVGFRPVDFCNAPEAGDVLHLARVAPHLVSSPMDECVACDLLVIGAGSGGLTAARFAARVGARVVLVDRRPPGGDCLYTGCVPSKALLKAARVAHEMRRADRWGLEPAPHKADLRAVMTRVEEAIAAVFERDSPEALERAGVHFIQASASFVAPHEVALHAGDRVRRVRAERVVIATGARPRRPPIDGIGDVAYETYETIFALRALPPRLLVVGNGPIGAELTQAFARLGSRVTLFCPGDATVAKIDPEAAAILGDVFRDEGVDVRLRSRVTRVRRGDDGAILVVDASGEEIAGDVLLVAAGRVPEVSGLDLAAAGVALAPSGAILVDDHLCTTARHVFACGDCTGGPQFTHHAGFQGFVAARNALFPGRSRGVRDAPWTLFTEPEIAAVGLDETSARRTHGGDVVVTRWPLAHVDRAQAEHEARGFLKVVHARGGRVLGACIAADRAGELAGEIALAIVKRATLADLAAAPHVYPTYAMGFQELAFEAATNRSLSGLRGRVLRALAVREAPPGPPRKRWLFTLMGAVFAAQAIGKLLDVGGYTAALAAFQLVPTSALSAVSVIWICAELTAAIALVAAGVASETSRPLRGLARFGAGAALAISLAYAVLDVEGYARGLPIRNCTCFGVYLAQRLSWFVLVQEAYVMAILLALLRKATRWRRLP